MSKDFIDILDVEGLQKENSVYYLLVAVIVLSKSIVLLSRERVNKEALGVLEIAFKMLAQLGIALKKPVIFIQTKMDKHGHLVDGDGERTTKDGLLQSIAKEIPTITYQNRVRIVIHHFLQWYFKVFLFLQKFSTTPTEKRRIKRGGAG